MAPATPKQLPRAQRSGTCFRQAWRAAAAKRLGVLQAVAVRVQVHVAAGRGKQGQGQGLGVRQGKVRG